jgi:ribosomal protein S12 methylthiotransferase accessory factor
MSAARRALTPALVPGGAILCDDRGQVRLGVRESIFQSLGDRPADFQRLAVAHLAAMYTAGQAARDHSTGLHGTPPQPHSRGGLSDIPAPRVIVAARFLDPSTRQRAVRLRLQGSDVLPVVRSGSITYFGPLLRHDGSPCIECVRRAVAANRPAEHLIDPTGLDPAEQSSAQRRALQLWFDHGADLETAILEVDGNRLIGMHHVRSFADCTICGRPTPDVNRLAPQLRTDHEHRDAAAAYAHSPAETIARLRHLVSPLTGVVRHVTPVATSHPELLHVWTAGHPVGAQLSSLREFMVDAGDRCAGKGTTADAAMAGALCEAIERASFAFRGDEVDALGAHAETDGARHPSPFLLFSASQYRQRERWNRSCSSFQRVPQPFDVESTVAWSRVWSLASREYALVPTALLYAGFRGPGAQFCRADSNGLAAGRTLEEAVLHAFLELVERDAVALWWYNRTRQPAVDACAMRDEYVLRVAEHYRTIGRALWVLDLTSDLGIPVYAAVSGRVDTDRPEIIFGFGADLNPIVALRRSIVEMNQMLTTVMQPPAARTRQLRGTCGDALDWWETATLEEHPWLIPAADTIPMATHARRNGWPASPAHALAICLDIAARHDLDIWLRNMTRPDIGLHVVKLLVPGLRHFWRRLAPGRLFDVPVRIGRLHEPNTESALNPVSLFV